METNATSKHQKCPDRISNLPEPITSYILSLLPIESAVATRFLSKSWKLRWTKITTLDFDEEPWLVDCETPQPMGFVEFVNMVLVNHTAGNIEKFRMHWGRVNITSVYLNIWVNYAIARNIRILEFDASSPSEYMDLEVELPGAIYTCGTLEVLKLSRNVRVKLHHVACLPKLSVMELIQVQFESDDSLHKLISGCPVLESLKFKRETVGDNLVNCKVSSPAIKRLWIDSYHDDPLLSLEINAPAVEFIALEDALSSTKISILDVASVKEAELDISYSTDDGEEDISRADMIVGIVEAFRRAKFLKLSESTVTGLGRAPNKLSTSFDRLTKLVVEFQGPLWSCVLDLIDRCIKLEVLDILCYSGDTYWRQPIRSPKCLSSSLRQVSFRDFIGLEDELGMIKFILSHGLLMERVTLCTHKKYLKIGTVAELCGFSRAFPACEISFS